MNTKAPKEERNPTRYLLRWGVEGKDVTSVLPCGNDKALQPLRQRAQFHRADLLASGLCVLLLVIG